MPGSNTLVSVAALILTGFALVWLSGYAKLGLGEASKTAVILAPLILFLVPVGEGFRASKGLGWKAKFSNIRTQDRGQGSQVVGPRDDQRADRPGRFP